MLVTFTTDDYPDITMFGDVALAMLEMMGLSATVPSAIQAADVPAALERLTTAIALVQPAPPAGGWNENEPEISMVHRAQPLIGLLNAAVKNNGYVMWRYSGI